MRREPVTSIHPIVRTHPVSSSYGDPINEGTLISVQSTGEKALFVNPQCKWSSWLWS